MYYLGYGIHYKDLNFNSIYCKRTKCICNEKFNRIIIENKNESFKTVFNYPINMNLENKDFIVLHANMISYENEKILLLGKTHTYKSRLTYDLVKHSKEYKFCSDDITFIEKDSLNGIPCYCRPFLLRTETTETLVKTVSTFNNNIDNKLSKIKLIICIRNNNENKSKISCIIENMINPSIENFERLKNIKIIFVDFIDDYLKFKKLIMEIVKNEFDKKCLY